MKDRLDGRSPLLLEPFSSGVLPDGRYFTLLWVDGTTKVGSDTPTNRD
jgi:hypothetical protein